MSQGYPDFETHINLRYCIPGVRHASFGQRVPGGSTSRAGWDLTLPGAGRQLAESRRTSPPRLVPQPGFAYSSPMRQPKTPPTLTRRQRHLLDFIEGYIRDNGFAPSLDEMGKHFGLNSLATVHKHLTNLETKGFIRRRPGQSRALELTPPEVRHEAIEIPLLGLAAAGQPIEGVLEHETVSVPDSMVRRSGTYALRVEGESMRDDGILDGDIVVVAHRETADNGQTVVAVLGGAATIKRFYRERGDAVRLQPANAEMKPIRCRASDLAIRGVVIGLLREY